MMLCYFHTLLIAISLKSISNMRLNALLAKKSRHFFSDAKDTKTQIASEPLRSFIQKRYFKRLKVGMLNNFGELYFQVCN